MIGGETPEDVEGVVIKGLGLEVRAEIKRVKKLSEQHKGGVQSCKFCAFRKFQRPQRYLVHLETHHIEDNYYSALHKRSDAQWHMCLAMHCKEHTLVVHRRPATDSKYLEASADLLRQWIQPDVATRKFLEGHNLMDLTMLLTRNLPSDNLLTTN